MKTAILIPVYQPGHQLIELIDSLIVLDFPLIMVVDDGSDEKHLDTFRTIEKLPRCKVIHHKVNLGKGAALKTGMKRILNLGADLIGCITVDADGQHLPEDVLKVTEAFEKSVDHIILGSRDFSDKKVPAKSKMGNLITRTIFLFLTGKQLADTQTGLRAIPIDIMDEFQDLPGSHFDFEMNYLFNAAKRDIPLREITIQTVYLDNNKSSHFNPLIDSFRIYKEIIKFCLSSLCILLVDLGLFAWLYKILLSNDTSWALFGATAAARLVSSVLNYLINKRIVWNSKVSTPKQTIENFSFCFIQMLGSWLILKGLSSVINDHIIFLKIVTDFSLFLIKFPIQQYFNVRRPSQNKGKNISIH